MNQKYRALRIVLLAGVALQTGCMIGPNYKRASAPTPPAYKEQPPPEFKEREGWKQAQPNEGAIKGKWWEIFNDPLLNTLEEQVGISNQNVLQAEALYREAREAVRIAQAGLRPTVGVAPAITETRTTGGASPTGARAVSLLYPTYSFPANVSWAPDLWGSVRRNVTAAASGAQASAAQLENVLLLYQSELAEDYFSLRGLDSEFDLLDRTVKSYQEYLTLTRNRFAGGVASDLDVAQAESQLFTTQSELTDLGVARAQMEHAIAVLTGKSPAELSISAAVLKNAPPPVPVGVPSALLERRPDIAQYERQMAAANEQIGIAKAAFYPSLSLSGIAGFSSSSFTTWISWPSRIFSVGPTLSETLYDAGRRRAALNQTLDAYDAAIAGYRQTVLTAFQQVEDNLATLRILSEETGSVQRAVGSSERALTVSSAQYKAGTTSYLTVITAQATALGAQQTAVTLLTRRLVATVALVQALGGGWDVSQLPPQQELTERH
jgi:NodT family efflux transporter outer membrane factor (OMF) lipoprotein